MDVPYWMKGYSHSSVTDSDDNVQEVEQGDDEKQLVATPRVETKGELAKTVKLVIVTLFIFCSALCANAWDKDTISLSPTNSVGLFYAQVKNGIMDINPAPGYVLRISVTILKPDATLYLWMHDDVFFFHRTVETLHPSQKIPLYSGMNKTVVLGGSAIYEIVAEAVSDLPVISHTMLHNASTMYYDLTGILRAVGTPTEYRQK